jgi:hypothetical protein
MSGSLRRQRDSQLEEPYRSWINGEVPLPADVIVLPRKIDVHRSAMLLTAVVLGCPTIAFLPLLIFQGPLESERFDPSTGSFWALVLIVSVIVFLHFLTIRRLYETLGARREQRRGNLRQGIIVGPAGVLVRLSPNKCFAIPLDRFLRAKPWSGSEDSLEEYICIETKDGNIDFSDRALAVDAEAVNQSVFEARALQFDAAKKQRNGK